MEPHKGRARPRAYGLLGASGALVRAVVAVARLGSLWRGGCRSQAEVRASWAHCTCHHCHAGGHLNEAVGILTVVYMCCVRSGSQVQAVC